MRDHSFDCVSPGVISVYTVTIKAQIGGDGRPSILLLNLFTDGMQEREHVYEAHSEVFHKVLYALGLRESSPSQLLLSLVARVFLRKGYTGWGRRLMLVNTFHIAGPWTKSKTEEVPVYEETAKSIRRIFFPGMYMR